MTKKSLIFVKEEKKKLQGFFFFYIFYFCFIVFNTMPLIMTNIGLSLGLFRFLTVVQEILSHLIIQINLWLATDTI